MLATSVACPKCRTGLKAAAGQKITCPSCGITFTAPSGRSQVYPHSIPIPREDTCDDEAFSKQKTRPDINVYGDQDQRDEERKSSKLAPVLIVAGVLLFFVVGTVAAIGIIGAAKSKNKPERASAARCLKPKLGASLPIPPPALPGGVRIPAPSLKHANQLRIPL